MAEGTINAYNLADSGVNVDKTQIQKVDGELTKAQNATTDTTGVGGGVRKRPGLVEFNGSALAGAALGGVGVPIVLQASSINGSALSGGPVRTTYWGKYTRSLGYGATQGWWTSTNGFTSAAGSILAGTPANPRAAEVDDGSGAPGAFVTGMPGAAVVYRNKLYYCGSYTVGTDRPPIRVFDGTDDVELTRVPHNANFTTNNTAIWSLLLVGESIYLSTRDGNVATDGTARTGRVFRLNPSTGALTPIGPQMTAGHMCYSLAWHAGRLWVGTIYRSSGADVPGNIYWIRPDIDTAWTLDRTMSQGRACTALISYKGELFAGNWTGATGVTAVVEKRTSLGVWSVSLTFGTGTSSLITNAVQFGTNLYVGTYDSAASTITVRKYDGTSWTTVLTTADTRPLPAMWVDSGVIYVGGGGANVSANLWSSTDGTSWTSRTANLPSSSNLNGLSMVGTLAV